MGAKPLPVKVTDLVGVLPGRDDMTEDELHAEAWFLHMVGHSKNKIAKHLDVHPSTVDRWIKSEALARRDRTEDVEIEMERLIGRLETITDEALQSYMAVKGTTAQVGPQYLKVGVDAVKEIARLRGIEPAGGGGGAKTTEVVVRIGGRDDVAVGVRAA